jgi:hypothetical protein
LQSSLGSAGAEPTAMSEAASRQATASLFRDTSPRCHHQRLVAIGLTAYLRFVEAYDLCARRARLGQLQWRPSVITSIR